MKKVTGHVSDALNKYQITSNKQKEQVSLVLKGGNDKVKSPKPKIVQEPIVPSLELSVTNKNSSDSGSVVSNCTYRRQSFNISDGNDLASMINDIVSK